MEKKYKPTTHTCDPLDSYNKSHAIKDNYIHITLYSTMKLPNKGTIFKNRPTKYAWLMNYLQKMKKLSFHMISRKIVFETQSEEIKEFFFHDILTKNS